MAGLISKMKKSIESSGGNRSKFINKIRADKKVRVRFLQELDSGLEVTMHDSFERGIDAVCRKHFDEDCPFCGEEDVTTKSKYCWSVWDVDAKEVKVFMWHATSKSPVNFLLSFYETYGTIMDRDYVLERKGTKFDTTYNVIPMDKSKFRNEKAKPYSVSAIMKMLDKGFPAVEVDYSRDKDDDDDEDEDVKAKSKKSKKDDVSSVDIEWIEERLSSEDIEEDDFCEYHGISSIKKLKKKSKKEIKKMIQEYIDADEEDDEEDEDEDDYDDYED